MIQSICVICTRHRGTAQRGNTAERTIRWHTHAAPRPRGVCAEPGGCRQRGAPARVSRPNLCVLCSSSEVLHTRKVCHHHARVMNGTLDLRKSLHFSATFCSAPFSSRNNSLVQFANVCELGATTREEWLTWEMYPNDCLIVHR